MKPIVRRGLELLLIGACVLLWSATLSMSRKQLRARTCQGKGTLEVIVLDSAQRNFVGREDIEEWLDNEYRAYAGLPLDSVDLYRIEGIITGHSAVRDCEAWLTDDGILHVQLSQREPIVRLDDGSNGYYADADGFIFPLQRRGDADVPVVDGKLPLKVARGYKGVLTDPTQKAWLEKILSLVQQLKGTPWESRIRHIGTSGGGELTLLPAEGSERFLFGQPVRIEEKIGLIDKYYNSVVPSKENGNYKTVDLRYRGQIVCRK